MRSASLFGSLPSVHPKQGSEAETLATLDMQAVRTPVPSVAQHGMTRWGRKSRDENKQALGVALPYHHFAWGEGGSWQRESSKGYCTSSSRSWRFLAVCRSESMTQTQITQKQKMFSRISIVTSASEAHHRQLQPCRPSCAVWHTIRRSSRLGRRQGAKVPKRHQIATEEVVERPKSQRRPGDAASLRLGVRRAWLHQHDSRILASLLAEALAPLLCAFTLDGLAAVFAAVEAGDGFHGVRNARYKPIPREAAAPMFAAMDVK